MLKIDPSEYSNQKLHKILLGGVAPRPIAFVSTIDKKGRVNLSPFSFYNAFGVNPTTLIFSPSRRGRDNTTKHTLENILEVPEVVINAVNYGMVQQMSLSSTEYPKGVNEFVKSGLTPVDSSIVKPPRVKESPLQFECQVREVIETGGKAGSANLVICEIVMVHIKEGLLDEEGNIDTDKIDLVLLNHASPLLKFQVARTGKPVYQKKPGIFAGFCSRALREHNDAGIFYRATEAYLKKVIEGGETRG